MKTQFHPLLAVQESVATAFDLAELDVDEISCQVMDEEIALLSVAPGFHFTLHTYPALGYVAVDLYSFEQTLPLTLIMKPYVNLLELKK